MGNTQNAHLERHRSSSSQTLSDTGSLGGNRNSRAMDNVSLLSVDAIMTSYERHAFNELEAQAEANYSETRGIQSSTEEEAAPCPENVTLPPGATLGQGAGAAPPAPRSVSPFLNNPHLQNTVLLTCQDDNIVEEEEAAKWQEWTANDGVESVSELDDVDGQVYLAESPSPKDYVSEHHGIQHTNIKVDSTQTSNPPTDDITHSDSMENIETVRVPRNQVSEDTVFLKLRLDPEPDHPYSSLSSSSSSSVDDLESRSDTEHETEKGHDSKGDQDASTSSDNLDVTTNNFDLIQSVSAHALVDAESDMRYECMNSRKVAADIETRSEAKTIQSDTECGKVGSPDVDKCTDEGSGNTEAEDILISQRDQKVMSEAMEKTINVGDDAVSSDSLDVATDNLDLVQSFTAHVESDMHYTRMQNTVVTNINTGIEAERIQSDAECDNVGTTDTDKQTGDGHGKPELEDDILVSQQNQKALSETVDTKINVTDDGVSCDNVDVVADNLDLAQSVSADTLIDVKSDMHCECTHNIVAADIDTRSEAEKIQSDAECDNVGRTDADKWAGSGSGQLEPEDDILISQRDQKALSETVDTKINTEADPVSSSDVLLEETSHSHSGPATVEDIEDDVFSGSTAETDVPLATMLSRSPLASIEDLLDILQETAVDELVLSGQKRLVEMDMVSSQSSLSPSPPPILTPPPVNNMAMFAHLNDEEIILMSDLPVQDYPHLLDIPRSEPRSEPVTDLDDDSDDDDFQNVVFNGIDDPEKSATRDEMSQLLLEMQNQFGMVLEEECDDSDDGLRETDRKTSLSRESISSGGEYDTSTMKIKREPSSDSESSGDESSVSEAEVNEPDKYISSEDEIIQHISPEIIDKLINSDDIKVDLFGAEVQVLQNTVKDTENNADCISSNHGALSELEICSDSTTPVESNSNIKQAVEFEILSVSMTSITETMLQIEKGSGVGDAIITPVEHLEICTSLLPDAPGEQTTKETTKIGAYKPDGLPDGENSSEFQHPELDRNIEAQIHLTLKSIEEKAGEMVAQAFNVAMMETLNLGHVSGDGVIEEVITKEVMTATESDVTSDIMDELSEEVDIAMPAKVTEEANVTHAISEVAISEVDAKVLHDERTAMGEDPALPKEELMPVPLIGAKDVHTELSAIVVEDGSDDGTSLQLEPTGGETEVESVLADIAAIAIDMIEKVVAAEIVNFSSVQDDMHDDKEGDYAVAMNEDQVMAEEIESVSSQFVDDVDGGVGATLDVANDSDDMVKPSKSVVTISNVKELQSGVAVEKTEVNTKNKDSTQEPILTVTDTDSLAEFVKPEPVATPLRLSGSASPETVPGQRTLHVIEEEEQAEDSLSESGFREQGSTQQTVSTEGVESVGLVSMTDQPPGITATRVDQPPGVTTPTADHPPAITAPRADKPPDIAAPRADQPVGIAAPRADQPPGVTAPRADQPPGVTALRADQPPGVAVPREYRGYSAQLLRVISKKYPFKPMPKGAEEQRRYRQMMRQIEVEIHRMLNAPNDAVTTSLPSRDRPGSLRTGVIPADTVHALHRERKSSVPPPHHLTMQTPVPPPSAQAVRRTAPVVPHPGLVPTKSKELSRKELKRREAENRKSKKLKKKDKKMDKSKDTEKENESRMAHFAAEISNFIK